MKFNSIKFVKIFSLIASVVGMIGSAWASDKENKATLDKLVSEKLSNNE